MAILLLLTTAFSGYSALKLYKMNGANKNSTSDIDKNKTEVSKPAVSENVYSEEELKYMLEEAHNQGVVELLGSIQSMMERGDSTLKVLRTLYSEYLVYNQTGGYVFKEINESLAMNEYRAGDLRITEDENEIPTKVEYYKDNKLVSYTGIDVSKHNGTIDWAKVKASGIDFAMLRAGVRGYGNEGKLSADDSFVTNAQGATSNDIAIGAYIFSEAITVEEAIEEANLILSLIAPYKITYPIVIDIEDILNDEGRNETLSPKELTDIVLTFCNKIKDAGYTPMIYCNLKGFLGMLEFERLEDIEKWYAYYGNNLYFPYDVSMWQYSSSGQVDGIKGNVDLNISFKNYSK